MAHSLATTTGTRVDSASKHIVPCRVSTDYMASLISAHHADNAMRELQVGYGSLFLCLSIKGTLSVLLQSLKKSNLCLHVGHDVVDPSQGCSPSSSASSSGLYLGLGTPHKSFFIHSIQNECLAGQSGNTHALSFCSMQTGHSHSTKPVSNCTSPPIDLSHLIHLPLQQPSTHLGYASFPHRKLLGHARNSCSFVHVHHSVFSLLVYPGGDPSSSSVWS
jgi:hypothetical protein